MLALVATCTQVNDQHAPAVALFVILGWFADSHACQIHASVRAHERS